MLEIEHISVISDEVRAVVEEKNGRSLRTSCRRRRSINLLFRDPCHSTCAPTRRCEVDGPGTWPRPAGRPIMPLEPTQRLPAGSVPADAEGMKESAGRAGAPKQEICLKRLEIKVP